MFFGAILRRHVLKAHVSGFIQWNTVLSWSLDRNKIEKLNNGVTENINRRWFVGEEIGDLDCLCHGAAPF